MVASRLEEVEICTAIIEDTGRTFVSKQDFDDEGRVLEQQIKGHPEVAQRSEARRHAQFLLVEFRLSPAVRSKVSVRIAEKYLDPQTAQSIAEDANPVLVNKTNAEPWYRSRFIQGLLVTAIGSAARMFDVPIGGEETVLIINGYAALVEFAGIMWALYGRLSTKPAVGE